MFNTRQMLDVYAGVRVDYRGPDVNTQVFERVLLGQRTGVGSGRVLRR